MSQTAQPLEPARLKIDRQVEDVKLSLAVSSDRPATAILKPDDEKIQTAPEAESKESAEKNLPSKPIPPPLLILDLNGCLVYREYVPGSAKILRPRPYLDDLFQYLFGPHPKENNPEVKTRNWEVMVWSSAQLNNVELMCQALKISKRPPVRQTKDRRGLRSSTNQLNDISNRLDALAIDQTGSGPSQEIDKPVERAVLDIWDRSSFDLSPTDYFLKVTTTKDLRKVWDKFSWTDPATSEQLKWGAHNTIIVDDSPDKLTLQPDNLCLVKEFKGDPDDKGLSELIEILKAIRDEPNIPEAMKKLKQKKTGV